MDILDGLSYLHNRHVIHGRLNSSNCLVDQRLTIKLTGKSSSSPVRWWWWWSLWPLDYGLDDLRLRSINSQSYIASVEAYRRVYYAPELISIDELKLTPPIDIYAYGIILNEIATRSEPYGVSDKHLRLSIGEIPRKRSVRWTFVIEWWYRSSDATWLSTKDRPNDARCWQWTRGRFLSFAIVLHSLGQTMSSGKCLRSSNV